MTLRAAPTEPADGEAPISVAMFTNLFAPVVSGSATQSMGLAATLAARGHKVVVITAHVDRQSAVHERIDGYDIYRIPALRLPEMSISLNFPWLNWTLWPANLRRMEDILRRHGVQVIHVHNHMFDLAFAGMILRRRLKLPAVLTLHTIIKHSIALFNLLLVPADRFVLKSLVVSQAEAVICPDCNVQRYLEERFSRQDGRLIPYGIDLPADPGQAVKQRIVEQYALKGKRVILSLGHVHALRNRLDLIRAMPRVRERFPNVRLLIVGAVADERPVALVKQLELGDAVIFTGPQPYADIPAYHALAELEAMWLDQADGGLNSLGIACMEGMYMARPVLTVSNEDTFGPGVLKNGRDIIILKAGDPDKIAAIIIDLLADEEKARRIGRAAEEVARTQFAWPSVRDQTLAVYRMALASSSSSVGPR